MKKSELDSAAIDPTSLWLTEALLPENASEADWLAIDQMKVDISTQPLDEMLNTVQGKYREEPGQFGLGLATALLYPWVLPAVHAFVKHVAGKFVEGAATEAGKMTASALKERISQSLSKDADPVLRRATQEELERCLVEKAHALKLPKATYEDFLQHIRNNPKILL